MYRTNKKPNSKGSFANAYKLSNIALDSKVEHDPNLIQLAVGCENDDTFYTETDEGRLRVIVETDDAITSFDLEEFINAVKELCPQLFCLRDGEGGG